MRAHSVQISGSQVFCQWGQQKWVQGCVRFYFLAFLFAWSADAEILLVPQKVEPFEGPTELFQESYFGDSGGRRPSDGLSSELNTDSLGQVISSRMGQQERSIIVRPSGFSPKILDVTVDIPVKLYITSGSSSVSCMILDEFQLRREVRPGTVLEFLFTPNRPGQYRIYCPMNGIEGTLLVKDRVRVRN